MRGMLARLALLVLSAVSSVSLMEWERMKPGGYSRDLRFTDKAGAHVVRFAFAPQRRKKTGDGYSRSQQLLVTHTVGDKQVWQAKDFVNDCELDLELDVLEGSIEVTDLDDDGVGEVSFLYKLGCRSDVSPLTVKLLMYEGTKKYALRGESYERVGETEYAGGTFTPDFDGAPRAFLTFAKAKWQRLVVDLPRPKD